MLKIKRKRHKIERGWFHECKRHVKWHTNMMARSRNRAEIHKIMQDPDNYEYNFDYRFTKMIWWIYD